MKLVGVWLSGVAIVALAGFTGAFAQEPPAPQYGFRGGDAGVMRKHSGGSWATIETPGPLVMIASDGEVTVHWKHVEELARTGGPDGLMVGFARTLLAVRDGKAKAAP